MCSMEPPNCVFKSCYVVSPLCLIDSKIEEEAIVGFVLGGYEIKNVGAKHNEL